MSWIGFIPQEAECQICGKKIFFGKKNRGSAIHFDHRNGGNELIQKSPTNWLSENKRTKEKEKIWDSCNFGFLCNGCNSFLPTKNRKQFIKEAVRYIGNI